MSELVAVIIKPTDCLKKALHQCFPTAICLLVYLPKFRDRTLCDVTKGIVNRDVVSTPSETTYVFFNSELPLVMHVYNIISQWFTPLESPPMMSQRAAMTLPGQWAHTHTPTSPDLASLTGHLVFLSVQND